MPSAFSSPSAGGNRTMPSAFGGGGRAMPSAFGSGDRDMKRAQAAETAAREAADARVKKLAADDSVMSRKGIFEFLLGGGVDTKLLEVRVFDKQVTRTAYAKQTQAVAGKGKSNCPLCAVGHGANKARIYNFGEMDADHVAAWSKGGDSSAKNCQMLCITHNRAKGNR
jgi:hypothetical protein